MLEQTRDRSSRKHSRIVQLSAVGIDPRPAAHAGVSIGRCSHRERRCWAGIRLTVPQSRSGRSQTGLSDSNRWTGKDAQAITNLTNKSNRLKCSACIDNQPALAELGTARGEAIGSRIMKAVPLPRLLSTRMRPEWASIISLQLDKPTPVPPLPVASGPDLVEKNGSKILGRTSGAIPLPLSRTVITTSCVAKSA